MAHVPASQALEILARSGPVRSVELFSHGTLLVKLYAPLGRDPQTPHDRDEVYVVLRGDGTFFDGEERHPVEAGDFLFAPAGSVHRFEDFSDDFATWVLYYGPEGGEEPTTGRGFEPRAGAGPEATP